jgi:hypothetical protein
MRVLARLPIDRLEQLEHVRSLLAGRDLRAQIVKLLQVLVQILLDLAQLGIELRFRLARGRRVAHTRGRRAAGEGGDVLGNVGEDSVPCFDAATGTFDDTTHRVEQTQEKVDQGPPIDRGGAIAHRCQQRFAFVKLAMRMLEPDFRCRALERVEFAEQGVQQLVVVLFLLQADEELVAVAEALLLRPRTRRSAPRGPSFVPGALGPPGLALAVSGWRVNASTSQSSRRR